MNNKSKKIAAERIHLLFELAKENYKKNPVLAQRYVDIARRVAMSNRLHLPKDFRFRVCRECDAFLVPGSTSRIRIRQKREPHLSITCLKCGAVKRISFRRNKIF